MENLLYSLWRFDDNGNHFEMRTDLPLSIALELRLEYERKGHKQTYYLKQNNEIVNLETLCVPR